MCGVFGVIGEGEGTEEIIKKLSKFAEKRGKDSSGILYFNKYYNINKAEFSITKLIKKVNIKNSKLFIGIGRLITNDNSENQLKVFFCLAFDVNYFMVIKHTFQYKKKILIKTGKNLKNKKLVST